MKPETNRTSKISRDRERRNKKSIPFHGNHRTSQIEKNIRKIDNIRNWKTN